MQLDSVEIWLCNDISFSLSIWRVRRAGVGGRHGATQTRVGSGSPSGVAVLRCDMLLPVLLAGSLVAGCGGNDEDATCRYHSECPAEWICLRGQCIPPTGEDAGDTVEVGDAPWADEASEASSDEAATADTLCGIDTDADTVLDVDEGAEDSDGDTVPSRLDDDSDGDGLPDGVEAGDADPCTAPADSDGDTVPDLRDNDSDGDTVADVAEGLGDGDGDTVPNRFDDDSDGDGFRDAEEAGDSDPGTPPLDTDGNSVPDFLDPGSAPCPLRPCTGPGQSCRDGRCIDDCRSTTAVPCGDVERCDWSTGLCSPTDTPCALFGAPDPCPDPVGGPEWACAPGTACLPEGGCVPTAPCARQVCGVDRLCHGEDCPCDRPVGSCRPASPAQLSDPAFTRSAMDLEFDDACHAYTVTMISGTDYLREMLPDGTLQTWAGVANLNMGEVAVLRRQGGEFGGTIGEVALTYICCAACGCAARPPQGVAHLERGTGALPQVIEAVTTSGTGPFGSYILDTGPYGLTWGRDRNLYVGNVTTNGEVHRIDLDAATTTRLATLPSRVYAQAPYDLVRLLVASADHSIQLLHTRTGGLTAWTTTEDDVTSLVRDPFTGRVYCELRDGRIVEYDADGSYRGLLATAPRSGRLTIAPDGGLYHIDVLGADSSGAQVRRYELPGTR